MTPHRAAQKQSLTALLPRTLNYRIFRQLEKSLDFSEKKWWAWQGLNLRPLRCQGRDTGTFPHKSALFRCSVARKKRERMGNCKARYRNLTAQVVA